jgi:hypothetical protein
MRLSAPPRPVRRRDLKARVALKALCFRNPGERFNTRQIRNLLRNPNAGVVFARARGILAGGTVELAVPAPPGTLFRPPLCLGCPSRLPRPVHAQMPPLSGQNDCL